MANDISRLLAQNYNLSLSDEEAVALSAIMVRRELLKEQAVAEIHQSQHHLFFIEKGVLRQFYYKDGRNVTEHFGAEGDVLFCIESLFQGVQTQQGIEALETSTVWTIDYKRLREFAQLHLGLNRLLLAILENALIVSQRKADSWRFESAHERYERFCREYPKVASRASVAHIASYLLMSAETLSRVRSGVL